MSKYIITHEPEREENVGSVGIVLGVEQAESPSSALSKWARRVLANDFNEYLDKEIEDPNERGRRRTDVALGTLELGDDSFKPHRVLVRQLAVDEYGNSWEERAIDIFD